MASCSASMRQKKPGLKVPFPVLARAAKDHLVEKLSASRHTASTDPRISHLIAHALHGSRL